MYTRVGNRQVMANTSTPVQTMRSNAVRVPVLKPVPLSQRQTPNDQ
jgi:hypothetical protein